MTILIGLIVIIFLITLSRRVSKIEDALKINPALGRAVQQPVPQPQTAQPLQVAQTAKVAQKASATQPVVVETNHLDSKSFVNALPKIGVIALVFGLAFFLKYAIDQGWISESLRLGLGAVVGGLLLVLFYLWKEKYAKYALVLAGGGLAIWYLTIFAAVEMYAMLSMNGGLIILSIVTIIGLLLAYKTKSSSLSALAWGGAFLSPIILSFNSSSYSLMLIYISIVVLGLLTSIVYTKSYKLFALIIAGTTVNLLFGLFAGLFTEEYYIRTLIFLIIHLCANTFVITNLIRSDKAENKEINQTEFGLLLVLIFAIFVLPTALIAYFKFNDYSTLIMTALAVWTFLIYAFIDRLELTKLNYLLSGFGTSLLVISVIWQFGDNSQVVMFYILGLVGIIVGYIQKRAELRAWGVSTVMVGLVSACLVSYGSVPQLIVTQKFGLEMLGLVALGVAYIFFKEDQLSEFEHDIHLAIQYLIAGFAWFFISWDLYNYYSAFDQVNQRNLSLSLWWLVYATLLLGASVTHVLKPLRKVGLLLFGLVIIKVFLYDVQSLDMVYRIISFISLGVILLVVSFIYQHNKEKIIKYIES